MVDHLFAYSHDPDETWGYLGIVQNWRFLKSMNHQGEPTLPHFFGVLVDVPSSRSLFSASRLVVQGSIATLEYLGDTRQVLCGEGIVQELQGFGQQSTEWFQRFAVLIALRDTLVLSSASEELRRDLGISD